MKRSQMNLLAGTLFIAIVGLSGCTGHDKMQMNEDMKHDAGMMKTQSTDSTNNKMAVGMSDPAKTEMDHKMDTMKAKMDEPMNTMKPETKEAMDSMKSELESSKEGEMKPME